MFEDKEDNQYDNFTHDDNDDVEYISDDEEYGSHEEEDEDDENVEEEYNSEEDEDDDADDEASDVTSHSRRNKSQDDLREIRSEIYHHQQEKQSLQRQNLESEAYRVEALKAALITEQRLLETQLIQAKNFLESAVSSNNTEHKEQALEYLESLTQQKTKNDQGLSELAQIEKVLVERLNKYKEETDTNNKQEQLFVRELEIRNPELDKNSKHFNINIAQQFQGLVAGLHLYYDKYQIPYKFDKKLLDILEAGLDEIKSGVYKERKSMRNKVTKYPAVGRVSSNSKSTNHSNKSNVKSEYSKAVDNLVSQMYPHLDGKELQRIKAEYFRSGSFNNKN